MSDFDQAIAIVLRHEGGFQKYPGDRGNWTSGVPGQGELKGTKFGISAMSYPQEDIEDLTEDRARGIYRKDFWSDELGMIENQGVAAKVLDIAVTMERTGRHGPAITILQKAICACGVLVGVDGILGAETVVAANRIDGALLLTAIKLAAVNHYREITERNPDLAKWLPGWEARARA